MSDQETKDLLYELKTEIYNIKENLKKMDERFDKMDERFDKMDGTILTIKQNAAGTNIDVARLKNIIDYKSNENKGIIYEIDKYIRNHLNSKYGKEKIIKFFDIYSYSKSIYQLSIIKMYIPNIDNAYLVTQDDTKILIIIASNYLTKLHVSSK